MSEKSNLIPIYTTRGDLGAFLVYPYIHNILGEWIGWVTPDQLVYSVHGHYVGKLDRALRILRPRALDDIHPRRTPPRPPAPIHPPAHAPLPPLMPELPFGMMDVLDEEPELLPCVDAGELREDLD